MSKEVKVQSSSIIDLNEAIQLPNGDLFVKRPRGYERPDTLNVNGLEPLKGSQASDEQAEEYAARSQAERSRQENLKGMIDQAASSAAKRL